MVQRSQAVTIRDVARRAGVSAATVSRYINRSASVASETAERIQQAMRALDYSPRLAARSLATRKTYTVGVITNGINYFFFGPLLWGIEEVLAEQEYRLLVATYWPTKDQDIPFGPHNTDGVLVFASTLEEALLRQWYEADFPCALMYHKPLPDLPIPCVNIENEEIARKLVEHLIEAHGKRRIAFLHAPDYYEDDLLREKGYRAALRRHGIPYDDALVLPANYRRETAFSTIREFLMRVLPSCDALFASDDDLALTTLGLLHQAGVRVPDQVAVVGFDDQPFAASLVPPLTTVRAPTEAIGRVAARQLLRLIQGETVEQETILPTALVIRHSCGCRTQDVRKDLSESAQESR